MGHYAYFDRVATLLKDLGNSWPITLEFTKNFPESTELQALLAEYLTRVVQLCHKIVVVAKRPAYSLLAGSILSSFDAEFKPIQDELDAYAGIIEKTFNILTTKAVQEQQVAIRETNTFIRLFHRDFHKSRRDQDLAEQQQRCIHSLSPQHRRVEAIWRRERKRGTTNWILEAPEYKSWKAGAGIQSVLRITGHLGTGKTVALANIIADLATEKKKIAGFICKRDDPNTLEGVTILGSIAQQLIESGAVHQNWEALFQQNPDLLIGSMTISSILQLLQSLLPRNQTFHVVLDGLQECAKDEAEIVLESLYDLRRSHQIFVCFSTTLDGLSVEFTEEYLGRADVLSLNDSQRDSEIHDYIRREVKRRNAVRDPPLNDELLFMVVEQLTLGAQGM